MTRPRRPRRNPLPAALLALLVATPLAASVPETTPIGRVKKTSGEAFLVSGEQKIERRPISDLSVEQPG